AAQAAGTHQQIVASGRRQRLGKKQPTLYVVDVVVYVGSQVNHPGDDVRDFVADFNTHAFGASQDVLVVQKVDRPTRSKECLIGRQRSRFGGEPVHRDPSLSEAGGGCGAEVGVGSIQ